ncbi:MAG: transketolase [Bacteroidota bacterium]
MNKRIDDKCADAIKLLAISMVEKAKSGHPGGPMGGSDFIHILYSEFLKFDPSDPGWMWRDRFFLDPGHLSAMLYAQLYLLEKFSEEEMSNFRQWGSPTPGHPELDIKRGIENTSGPLGQGHAMGVGAALAGKFLEARFGDWTRHTIYAYISDGGIQEEISQGVGRIAGYLGLSNLVMFFDDNDVQLSTYTKDVTSENTQMKYESWGWRVLSVDGHDHNQIRTALKAANEERDKPVLIIGKTIMGKGCVDSSGNPYEGYPELHGKPIGNTSADFSKTVQALGGSIEEPTRIDVEVKDFYKKILEQKEKEAKERKQQEKNWRVTNPALAKKLDTFLDRDLSHLDFSKVEQKANAATRDASSNILSYLAGQLENMIVASADLANSDKTDGFLKKTNAFAPGQFDANFLHAGVSEFSMAAMANGMALHGGVIPVVGTFFIFSDYQKPAIRLSSLMELPVIYLWTHDAFRVGEDGPTHQPIEQEAQIRLMEQVKNHSGARSFTALRPADAQETTVSWEIALNNTKGPSGLILSRQGIKDLPAEGDRYQDAKQAINGAYKVVANDHADITLIASGSEVATLVEATNLLEKEGIKCNVVSVPSEGVFRDQSTEYQESVLGNLPKYGLTAGLPVALTSLVGSDGKVDGLDHFGYSAPASVLDQKFGFTGEEVSNKIRAFFDKKMILEQS